MARVSLSGEHANFLLEWKEDGSGDFLVSIEAEADDFRGHADGHVTGKDLRQFTGDLKRLDQARKGKAQLISAAPGEFEVTILAIDGAGHMAISGVLSYLRPGPERPAQKLEFFFEFDPSQLHQAVNDAHAV
jgi:hypothetical protein